jgi:hypothetical protein
MPPEDEILVGCARRLQTLLNWYFCQLALNPRLSTLYQHHSGSVRVAENRRP